jgi:hypothetical protein
MSFDKTLASVVLVGAMSLGLAGKAYATANSNSITVDNIKFTIETDKPVYGLGQNVYMTYRVTNLRSESVTFGFSSSQQYDFSIYGDTLDWRWSDDKVFAHVLTSFSLSPNEFEEFNAISPQIPLTADLGTHSVSGVLTDWPPSLNSEVAVDIEIIPEPATLSLVALGGLAVIRRKRN